VTVSSEKSTRTRFRVLRTLLFFAVLLAIGGASAILAFPALQNMLTPLSERYRHEGDTFIADGRLPESVLSYRQAVEADPKNVQALLSLAGAYEQQGRLRLANRYRSQVAALRGEEAPPSPIPETKPHSLALHWLVQAGEVAPTGGVISNGLILAAYEDGLVAAVRADDGALQWKTRLPDSLTSAPAADGKMIYVGDIQGNLHALSLADGHEAWSFTAGGSLHAAPLAAGETIFCSSSNGTLFALAPDRSLRWKFTAPVGLYGAPTLAEGRLYLGANDGRLYALDASSGALAWPSGIATNGAIESQPVVADGRVIFGSGDGRIYALAVESGGQYWRYSTPDAVFAPVVVQEGVVYVASSGKTLSAADFLSGRRIWQSELPAPLRNPPAVQGERIYQLGEANPDLFVLDRQSGKLLESIPTGDWTAAGPWIEGNSLFILGKDGAVLAYSLPG